MKKYLLFTLSLCLSFISFEIVAQNSVVVTAFLDQNGNGIDDEGSVATGLLTTELFLVESGSGITYNHVEAGGVYTFDDAGAGLPDGTYTLQYVETPWTPAAIVVGAEVLAITQLNAGGPTMDNDVEPISGISAPFALSGMAQTEVDIDLGLYFASAIGDFVWEDINGDGFQDGELGNGLDGLTVTLLDGTGAPAVDTDMNPVPAEVTAGGGNYLFGNLAPGDYIVQFTAPVGPTWFATTFTGGNFANDSDADPANLLQSPIYNIDNNIIYNENIDAGFVQAVSIGDFVWEDLNGDGVQDGGEPGIGGVTVSLLDDTGAPAIGADGLLVPDQVTDGGGFYQFMNVAPGDYRVEFSLPAPIGGVDWYPTTFDPADVEPDDSATDNDANNNPADPNYLRTNIITVESAETDEETRIDAGFWLPAMVGNKVFCDENGNGVDDDGAGGVDGVDVTLVDANSGAIAQDADGTNLVTTTAGGGMYMFELVPPGDYFVRFQFTGATPQPPFTFTLQNDPDGLGDDFSDSDAGDNTTGTFGETDNFTVTSQDTEEEEKWDAGVYQVINIFGTIWIENDMNNMFDGEVGPGGVFLEIFNADDDSKVDEAFTNAGDYEFLGLAPGNYYIAFGVAGTALESATPCPGSNDAGDMVDNDDNGIDSPMVQTTDFTLLSNCDVSTPPEVMYIDFCYFFDCNEPNLLASTACDDILDSDIICDISILGNFCNIMPTADSPGNQPNPLCADGGAPHNISWFAFVAYGGTYSITVTPTGCSGSTTNQEGVQIGLYTDCTFTESVFCDPACSTDPVNFDSSVLEEGQTYYFFIDGCSGSVCSYEVTIDGNPMLPNLTPDDVCIDNNGVLECMDATFCPDAAVDFVATDFNLTVDFTWEVSTISGTPYSGEEEPMTLDEVLSISFPDEGVYEICLTQVSNGCSAQEWNGSICRQITIEGIDDEEFIMDTLCRIEDFDVASLMPTDPNLDGTIGWQEPSTVFDFGTNTAMITTADGCMYEQEIELMMFPASDVGLFDMTYCREDLPVMIDGTQYSETTFGGALTFSLPGLLLVNETDVNGCDSIIDIELEILDIFDGNLTAGICTPDGIILEFDYDMTDLSTDESFITWVWTDPNGNELPDDTFNPTDIFDNIAPTGINGEYVFTGTVDKDGVICTFVYMVDVNFDALLPPTPSISGPPLEICESDSIQTYTATDFGDAFNFNWDVPNGVDITAGGGVNDETITVNWAGTTGGTIELFTVNGCGDSELVDVTVTLVPILTPAFDATAEVCVGLDATIMFLGDQTDVDSYMWDFDGGMVTNATGGTGPGPHEITWADAGDYTVTLSVMHNGGCLSTQITNMVSVIAPPTPPTLDCSSSSGEVTFTWNLIPGTVEGDYSVDVTSGQSGGVQSGTDYTITGLAAGTIVNITLTIQTNDACIEISLTGSCPVQDCTPPVVSIAAPGDVVDFCLNGTDQTFNLVENIPMGVIGTGTFTGDGITDMALGTFDPDAANVGPNTINYSYLTDEGCIAAAQIVINIFETPIPDFITDVDTICITDEFQLTYTGTTGVNVINWDTGDGQTINGETPTVSFATPGPHIISLDVERDGCPSTSVSRTVFVQDTFPALMIDCSQQEINFVEFSWNDIPGATGYEVTVTLDDGTVIPPFTTTSTTHMETGLNPDDVIGISVVVIVDNSFRCPAPSGTGSCVATACPTFTITIDIPETDFCVDGTNAPIQLQALATGGTEDGTFTWSGSGNIVNGNEFDPNGLPEGPVTLFVEYVEGGCGGNSMVELNITQVPTATFDVDLDPVCIGSTVPITFTGSQLTNQVIDWSGSDVAVTNVSGNDYEATFDQVGTFDIVLDVVNGACTTTPMTATITVEPELVFGMDDISCAPTLDSIAFSWNVIDCATEYEVIVGGVSQGIQSGTTFNVTGLVEGQEVDLMVRAISECACDDVVQTITCEAQACAPITIVLTPMGGVQEFCMSPDLTPVEILADPQGTQGTGSGVWSGTGVDENGIFDPMTAGVGIHVITFDWLESEGCPSSETITFEIFDTPTLTAVFDPINCFGDSTTTLTIDPQGGDGVFTVLLDNEEVMLISEVEADTYDIIVTDGNQCTDMTSVTITIPAEPMPVIDGDTLLIVGETSNYSINSAIFTGLAIDSIVWTANGEVVCNTADCFSLSNEAPIETTIYEVTVFYNDGCSVTRSIVVDVEEADPIFLVTFPNAISPNNDGNNDVWSIFTNDPSVEVTSLQIYDRWGDLVYSPPEVPYFPANTDVAWDGRMGTTELQPGVYVYVVEYTQTLGNGTVRDRNRSGDVTIIK